jgi:hypothetical protein
MAGVGLSVVNILMGFAVIQFTMGRSYTTFIQIVLGGIAVRLFVMVGLLLFFVGVLRFHAVSLVGLAVRNVCDLFDTGSHLHP